MTRTYDVRPTDLHAPSTATQPVSTSFMTLYGLAWFGLYVALLAPVVVSMALRIGTLFPDNKAQVLSLVLGTGALFALLANPIAGMLSDRVTRTGRRRPFLIGGVLLGALGLLIIAASATIPAILLGWCLTQVGFNAAQAALSAILPDQVPEAQRGRVGGVVGVAISVGIVGGVFVAQALQANNFALFMGPAAVAVVLVTLFALTLGSRDKAAVPGSLPPLTSVRFLKSFWIDPHNARDFWWAFSGRFMLFLGLATLTTYQVFFLTDHLKVPTAQVAYTVFIATLVSTVASVIGSGAGGFLSDRTGRRKIFVIIAALIYAAALVVITRATGLDAFYIGMALAGLGQGVYLAVDLALVTDVLPNPEEAAKDLGIFNIASAAPQSLAPAIAPVFLAIGAGAASGGGNYVALFAVATMFALVGAFLVQPIRKAR
ncbi:MFS transporter (plasmid) [Deinococcus taeanensis]|uniref:MFS transporter n=1 Tax=Deinococcus taeanensis TaxID=2737050 RepID=UPI001CDC293A|nr:MFS transporter [Deinococcus taeanensis]UBV45340.1 MFS transporter [Deinococcus taeanensis]